ncbi:MAG: hypothetical protein AABX23_00940 [Nanoarchaeota archaeon]
MATLKAKFIIEILGRPVEHLEKSLSDLIEKLGTEKGVSLLHKEINKAKKVEKTDNLWTAFADIDLSFESLPLFLNIVMTYLPAHVEIYEPDMFKMNAFETNEFANFVVSRLHNYDALAKRMMGEREILISKLEYIRKGGDPKVVFATPEQPSQPVSNQESNKEKPKKDKKKKSK